MVHRARQRVHREDVHVSTNLYLSVCTLLLSSILYTGREAKPSEQKTYRGLALQKECSGHDRNHLCAEPDHQQDTSFS